MAASTGASLTGVTVMFRVTVLLFAVPSLTVKLTVRVSLLGLSLVFWYCHRPQGRLVVGHRVRAAQGQACRWRRSKCPVMLAVLVNDSTSWPFW